jgi:hypothetical protein
MLLVCAFLITKYTGEFITNSIKFSNLYTIVENQKTEINMKTIKKQNLEIIDVKQKHNNLESHFNIKPS